MSMTHEPGSYVTHNKLPELGSGQVVSSEKGTIRIRFASGERNFLIEAVQLYLEVSAEGPAMPPSSARKSRARAKAKPMAKPMSKPMA
jgi:hypothetical protein